MSDHLQSIISNENIEKLMLSKDNILENDFQNTIETNSEKDILEVIEITTDTTDTEVSEMEIEKDIFEIIEVSNNDNSDVAV
ncbi:8226_t:CDS:1, partial [Scutellospora calospora]